MPETISILVTSCDSYEDCWDPYFQLFQRYWPKCPHELILNTERKVFSCSGLSLVCPAVASRYKRKLGWGERLLLTLDAIQTDFILLTLDDFFIKAPVNASEIERLVGLMNSHDLARIGLTSELDPNLPSQFVGLLQRGQRAPYRLTLQASLWLVDRLRYYIRKHEDQWQTENWGTRRAWQVVDSFFCMDPEFISLYGPIMDYDWTGVIARGRWIRDKIEPILSANHLCLDLSKRGFWPGWETASWTSRIHRRLRWSEIKSSTEVSLRALTIPGISSTSSSGAIGRTQP